MKARLAVLFASVLASACGDAQESDAEIGSVESAWGEYACGSSANVNASIPIGGSVTSPNGNYDHNQPGDGVCRHAFIATGMAGTKTSAFARYSGALPTPSFLGCDASWSALGLWRLAIFQIPGGVGSRWDRVGDTGMVQGSQVGDTCIPAEARFRLPPGGGIYKLVAQAGAIFSYQPVTVGFM